jgi:hypothetical protein
MSRHAEREEISRGSPTPSQSDRHLTNGLLRHAERRLAIGFHPEESLGSAATLGGRLTDRRANVTLRFETIQRRVDRANREAPTSTLFDFAPYCHSVRVVLESHEGEKDDVFQ